jgi:hypothetical protein
MNPRSKKQLSPRERELLRLFQVMAEADRRLLLSTARKLIATEGEECEKKGRRRSGE